MAKPGQSVRPKRRRVFSDVPIKGIPGLEHVVRLNPKIPGIIIRKDDTSLVRAAPHDRVKMPITEPLQVRFPALGIWEERDDPVENRGHGRG
jgi:hypothetical protein